MGLGVVDWPSSSTVHGPDKHSSEFCVQAFQVTKEQQKQKIGQNRPKTCHLAWSSEKKQKKQTRTHGCTFLAKRSKNQNKTKNDGRGAHKRDLSTDVIYQVCVCVRVDTQPTLPQTKPPRAHSRCVQQVVHTASTGSRFRMKPTRL